MNLFKQPFAMLIRRFRPVAAAAILGIAGNAIGAEPPTTHHFSIVRPAAPIIVGSPVQLEITARLANNKINKKGEHALLIQMTSGQGPRSQTITKEATMSRGVANVTVSFQDAGATILQVSDASKPELSNSASISVLPQPRSREVRQ